MSTPPVTSHTEEPIHIWHHCHHCKAAPIVGKRYHCETCPAGPDNDLCETCYDLFLKGQIKHPAEESYADTLGMDTHHFTSHEGKSPHLYESWLSVPHPPVPEPPLPHPFVVRPIFTSHGDSVMAGYAFAVKIDGRHSFLLTALHVMDEMIKKKGIDCTDANTHYTGKELPAVITEVNIYDIFAPNWMLAPLGSAGPMLVLPDARTSDEEPYSHRDIAVFTLEDTSELKLPSLAQQPPASGEPVWLIARPGQPHHKNAFKAVVVEQTDRSLVFKYESPEEKPGHTSGAPMLNKHGEVVGIIVGGGEFRGHKLGHANHAGNIRKHLFALPEK